MGKFRLGPDYLRTFAAPLREAALMHLRTLYDELMAPVRPLLETPRLIVAPHGKLHQVPFHALYDGCRHLLDDFEVSVSPSASVHALCRSRRAGSPAGSLVMGIPDDKAPWIADEAQAVAATLPDARVFIGHSATEAELRAHAPGSRFVHVACHGMFRRDNPAFSAIRLGDSWLSLHDLYSIPLSAELVVLSGCSTGMNAVTGGDELIGLMRGLLHAGARSVMLSLWDIQDRSASEFMTAFYRNLQDGRNKAESWRGACLEHRENHPHPSHWAPYVFIGSCE